MKRAIAIQTILLACALTACGSSGQPGERQPGTIGHSSQTEKTSTESITNSTSRCMKIIIGTQAITATMEDNAAARDLLSRLPLDIVLNDFNHTTEKIFYPEPPLDTQGTKGGCAPTPGDITIYAPWGNVAIFCKSWTHSSDLIKIGHIDGQGIAALQKAGNINIRLER